MFFASYADSSVGLTNVASFTVFAWDFINPFVLPVLPLSLCSRVSVLLFLVDVNAVAILYFFSTSLIFSVVSLMYGR